MKKLKLSEERWHFLFCGKLMPGKLFSLPGVGKLAYEPNLACFQNRFYIFFVVVVVG
jgi:hypothetical protein